MPPLIVFLKLPYSFSGDPYTLIINMIEAAYNQLRSIIPEDVHIVMVWHEYGFNLLSMHPAMLTSSQKKFFKSQIYNLLENKQEITIIAGSVLYTSNKYGDNFDQKVLSNYEEAICSLGMSLGYDALNVEYRKLQNLLSQANHQLRYVTNLCYIFTKSNKEIVTYKRYKCYPFDGETTFMPMPANFSGENRAFYPKKSDSLIMRFGGHDETFAIEMCVEHRVGFLLNKCLHDNLPMPDYHFIIAHGCPISQQNLVAKKYSFFVDRIPGQRIIQLDQSSRLCTCAINASLQLRQYAIYE